LLEDFIPLWFHEVGEKKTQNLIKLTKILKKNLKKLNSKKNSIKLIKILKKPAGSVRFRFYKQKNRTEPKPEKTGKKPSLNRAKPEKPSQISLNRFLS
jgi:superfamily I DNA and RNA helicase